MDSTTLWTAMQSSNGWDKWKESSRSWKFSANAIPEELLEYSADFGYMDIINGISRTNRYMLERDGEFFQLDEFTYDKNTNTVTVKIHEAEQKDVENKMQPVCAEELDDFLKGFTITDAE